MSLTPGTRLGPYEIIAALGAGGMGEVYRAIDSHLKRSVAIKVLPASVAGDADRLARFQREAEVLAALNHPNIAAIYGIEDLPPAGGSPGSRGLVMELVDGEDLSAHIARGAIPLADALPIVRQIADALEAAHEQGIVHRDLKPQNIKVRADGTVKVLDFGLAKAMDPSSGSSAELMHSPTMTARATAMGMIIGTAAYMSPEQARGKAVDRRADIWAFGAVLYEMLTGQRAFEGDEITDVLAAVLRQDIDWTALPAGTPPPLRRLLERCLDRDPRTRLRDIGEARILLANPIERAGPAATNRTSRPSWMVATGALALAGFAAAAAWYVKPVSVIPLRRIELPSNMAGAPTRGLPGTLRPVLSPDGASVAYIDRGHLWVRGLDAVDSRELSAVPADAHALAWSPDSRSLAFAAEQTLRTMPAAGGPAFVVCRIPASGRLMGLAWSPDGQLVMAVWRDSLYSVRASGGEPTVRLAVDAAKEVDFHEVAFAPDGGLIVSRHIRGSTDLRTELVRGAERTILWDGTGVTRIAYAAPEMALVQRTAPNTGVWAAPWTAGHLDLGSAMLVAAGAVWFAVADDGTLLYGLPAAQPFVWAWVDRAGAISPTHGAPQNLVTRATLSPDGRRVAFAARKGGKTDIFVRDLATGGDTQLTSTTLDTMGLKANPSSVDPIDAVQSPNWFPSGDRLLYAAGGVESARLVSQRADTAEPPQPFGPGTNGAVSRDGRVLLALVDDRGARFLRRFVIGADGRAGPPEAVLAAAKEPHVAQFELSRDGRLLAFATRDADNRLFLSGFPDAQRQVLVDENGREPHFSADGRELFYVKMSTDRSGQATESLVSVPIVPGTPVKIGIPTTIYVPKAGGPSLEEFNVAPDGRRFLLRVPVALPPGEGAKLIYVQNWRAGLKK